MQYKMNPLKLRILLHHQVFDYLIPQNHKPEIVQAYWQLCEDDLLEQTSAGPSSYKMTKSGHYFVEKCCEIEFGSDPGTIYPEKIYSDFKETQKLVNNLHPDQKELISDGFHSFKDLYLSRMLYNAAFFNSLKEIYGNSIVCKSWNHSDGTPAGENNSWFIVVALLPTGQISQHYDAKYWDLFKIPAMELPFKYDGHTNEDVLKRLSDCNTLYLGRENNEIKFSSNINNGSLVVHSERLKQIEKYGYTAEHAALHPEWYDENQLISAGIALISQHMQVQQGILTPDELWVPKNWDYERFTKYLYRSLKDKLILAASFFVAEWDRLDLLEKTKDQINPIPSSELDNGIKESMLCESSSGETYVYLPQRISRNPSDLKNLGWNPLSEQPPRIEENLLLLICDGSVGTGFITYQDDEFQWYFRGKYYKTKNLDVVGFRVIPQIPKVYDLGIGEKKN